jgi:hypothetical protein
MIDFKLLSRGFVSLHAAAAANSGGAVVFPGRGGTFKTSLMMDYVRELNYSLLGDDRIIVKENNVFSFPVHSKLFDYRINNMKTEDYLRFDKYKYLLYQRFHKQKCNYITDKARISSIYFIIKSTEKDIKVLEISKSDVLAKTVQSHKMETISGPVIMGVSKGLYDYFAVYSYVFPRNKIAYYWDIYESILDKSLNNNKYYEIFLPRTYSKTTFRKFAKLVEELEEKQCKHTAIPSII